MESSHLSDVHENPELLLVAEVCALVVEEPAKITALTELKDEAEIGWVFRVDPENTDYPVMSGVG